MAADLGVPRSVALAVPWIELVVGALGLVPDLLPWSAYVMIAVLLVLTVVIVFVLTLCVAGWDWDWGQRRTTIEGDAK